MYGGTARANESTTEGQASELALDEVYILSLPSFVWFKAEYNPIASRYAHTCHVVGAGQRQLLTIGGMDMKTANDSGYKDTFGQGLGIFDLTNLTWSTSYNLSAANYTTPQKIKQYLASA